MNRRPWLAPIGVFGILWISYANFWQARDWNISSRLMLTYALADRGTIEITGLEDHTRDRARIGRCYYSDKLPGFSVLAVPPYLLAKTCFQLPEHPLNRPGRGFTHWPADYAVTLGTSGLATALTGALLAMWALAIGCSSRLAVLVGLAYGLATPAYAYATLAYGHQLTSFALLASYWLIWTAPGRRRSGPRAGLAGFLAALAVTVELQVAPVAAVLGLYLFSLVIARKLPAHSIITFGLGALVPLGALLVYNVSAFGSPWDMGYFHEDIAQFSQVHSRANPLGLQVPDTSKIVPLLWGRYRGLLFYAPVLVLAPVGEIVLARRRFWGLLGVTAAACLVVFLVNLSYPEWTGGWSTGPRLLVPLLPFAFLPVAALLAAHRRLSVMIMLVLTLLGAVLMLMFVGIGARVPQDVADPLFQFVWPCWRGDPLPAWAEGQRFARNAVSLLAPGIVRSLPPSWQWLQFTPLIVFQVVATALLLAFCRPSSDRPSDVADTSTT